MCNQFSCTLILIGSFRLGNSGAGLFSCSDHVDIFLNASTYYNYRIGLLSETFFNGQLESC